MQINNPENDKSFWEYTMEFSSGHVLCKILYVRHHNPLLIWNHSWILTIHKARILRKKPLEKTFLDIKKWVKSIQTAGYNGACTVVGNVLIFIQPFSRFIEAKGGRWIKKQDFDFFLFLTFWGGQSFWMTRPKFLI